MCINRPEWAKSLLRAKKYLNPCAYCVMCARQTNADLDLCASCASLLPLRLCTDRNGHKTTLCPGCGLEHPVNKPWCDQFATNPRAGHDALQIAAAGYSRAEAQSEYCSDCRSLQAQVHVVAPYRYAFPIDQMIKKMKYGQDRQLSRVLGTLLGRAVVESDTGCAARSLPQVLLPMPLHTHRRRQRGFNQAEDMAYWAGKFLRIRMDASLVSREVDTGSLSGLNRHERQLRILGAFRAEERLFGRRVAIVDDVLTTGASARELARELYDSGASSVELWVLARTSSARRVG